MSIGHPSPHRERVDYRWLFAALAIGPAAWIVQLVLGYGVAAQACDMRREAGASGGSAFAGEPVLLSIVNLVGLVAVLAGGIFCRWAWNRVGNEKAGGPEAVLTIGEGRTRFLAVFGMLSAVGFTIAVAFNTVEPLIMPACWTGVQ